MYAGGMGVSEAISSAVLVIPAPSLKRRNAAMEQAGSVFPDLTSADVRCVQEPTASAAARNRIGSLTRPTTPELTDKAQQ